MSRYKAIFFLQLLLLLNATSRLEGQSSLPAVNTRRLDSIFHEQNIAINYSIEHSTCYVLPADKKVILATDLLSALISDYHVSSGAFFIESILSHEYGHIKQYENGVDMKDDSIFMQRELHCDLMAGFYLSNYFREEFLKDDISDKNITNKVCSFFASRSRNPNLYLIVSMLINSIYDYQYDPRLFKGFSVETVKLLRFTAFWQGIRFSSSTSIDKVYSDGLDYIHRLLDNKDQDKTFSTFNIIGLDILDKILHGTYGCQRTVLAIADRIRNSNLPPAQKWEDVTILALVRSCCP